MNFIQTGVIIERMNYYTTYIVHIAISVLAIDLIMINLSKN